MLKIYNRYIINTGSVGNAIDVFRNPSKDGNIIFSTTNYHVFRSGVIASNQGINCEGIGIKTKWYFYTNALIREFIATLFQEKKKHIALLILINISLLVLIYIGKYCGFLFLYN